MAFSSKLHIPPGSWLDVTGIEHSAIGLPSTPMRGVVVSIKRIHSCVFALILEERIGFADEVYFLESFSGTRDDA